MLPVKISPSKETRRRNGANGSDAGDIEYANPHHSNEGSPQKALLSHSHYPSSDKPMVSCAASLSLSYNWPHAWAHERLLRWHLNSACATVTSHPTASTCKL